MAQSLLQNKRFFCREWAFAKIYHCLENRPSSKTCGALIVGGPGCGKTALCCEMVWPTEAHGRQRMLNKRILTFHFCQAHDMDTLSVASFIAKIVQQLAKSELVSGYQDKLEYALEGFLKKTSEKITVFPRKEWHSELYLLATREMPKTTSQQWRRLAYLRLQRKLPYSLGKNGIPNYTHDMDTLSVASFIAKIVQQLTKSELVSGYQDKLEYALEGFLKKTSEKITVFPRKEWHSEL
uniref:Nephrocystin 3-like N-terminal domain-containing protein n=1 Tax=Strigamia maritima TaxID=126957 RepID=T1JP80_STRMM